MILSESPTINNTFNSTIYYDSFRSPIDWYPLNNNLNCQESNLGIILKPPISNLSVLNSLKGKQRSWLQTDLLRTNWYSQYYDVIKGSPYFQASQSFTTWRKWSRSWSRGRQNPDKKMPRTVPEEEEEVRPVRKRNRRKSEFLSIIIPMHSIPFLSF